MILIIQIICETKKKKKKNKKKKHGLLKTQLDFLKAKHFQEKRDTKKRTSRCVTSSLTVRVHWT